MKKRRFELIDISTPTTKHSKKLKVGNFQNLSTDEILIIFEFLPLQILLGKIALVSKEWRKFVWNYSPFWQTIRVHVSINFSDEHNFTEHNFLLYLCKKYSHK